MSHSPGGTTPVVPSTPSAGRTRSSSAFFLRGLVAVSLAVSLAAALSVGATAPAAAVMAPMAVPAASTALQNTLGKLGERPGATRIPVPITDQVSASVDVGTGNLMLQIAGLSVPGITGDTTIGLTGNSLSQETSSSSAEPRKFELTAGAAGSLSTVSGGVIYEGPDGYTAKFTAVAGSTTAFTAPAGVKAELVKTSTGYTLTWRQSAAVVEFNNDGRTTAVADRNGNKTTYTYTNGVLSKVVGTRGTAEAKTATISTSSTAITVTQSTSSENRTVKFEKDSTNDLTAFVDAEGKRTEFETFSGQVRKITSPTGAVTDISYDASDRVTAITERNTTTGSPGDSSTRFAYSSATQTLVADPNTNQGSAVSAVPRTTYTLNADQRVTAATDAMGRAVSKTYTPDFDTATATSGTGASAGTTTNTFGANDGESLTKSTSPGGAAGQAGYGNTAANTKYLATSSTDDATNTTTYTYNGAGNPLTTTDAMASQATLTYNPDGTVATALAPGNGTNTTKYAYDANKQLIKVTPVTGSSLGVKDFTYDTWGRLATATDGRGNTITYSYDKVDRITKVDYSDATADVTYTYDGDGRQTTRVDGTGTTTWGYDQLGRLITRANTAGGGTISYAYDKASNLTSTTDTRGTTRYLYDDSGTPTELKYLLNGVEKTLAFATDDRGRRTDTWLDANASRTSWAAHTHTDYDTTGRVTRVRSTEGFGTSEAVVADLSYCYAAGTTPAGGCNTTTANDRAKIQWTKNAADGSAMAYTYDKRGWLTKAVRTGGDRPYTYNYTYDERGNRKTANASEAYPAQNYTFNAANQLTNTGFTYDGAGNLTQDPKASFAYNAAQQMTSTTRWTGSTYNYTYAGTTQQELTKQNTTRGNYEYVYGREDAVGNPVIEQIRYDGSTGYIERDPVTGEPLMLRTPSGMQSLYVYDGIGNPTALITNMGYTATAYDYDPYGVPTLTKDSGGWGTPVNPYQFKGGLHDRTTNWVKFGHRWYSTEWGRFSQQDTLDAPLDPGNANRYAFAANDPINNADPLGLYSAEDIAFDCLNGAAQGAAVGIALSGPSLGTGVVVGAVSGCGLDLLFGYIEDQADTPAEKQIRNAGNSYANFLDAIVKFGKAIR